MRLIFIIFTMFITRFVSAEANIVPNTLSPSLKMNYIGDNLSVYTITNVANGPILNLENGIYYNLSEASLLLNTSKSALSQMLNKRQKGLRKANKYLNFIYT